MLVIKQMGPIDFHRICFHTMEVMGYINCLCPHSSKYLLHLIQNELLQKTFLLTNNLRQSLHLCCLIITNLSIYGVYKIPHLANSYRRTHPGSSR